MRPKAEWAIDSEPIRARGIIVNNSAADASFMLLARGEEKRKHAHYFIVGIPVGVGG